ncbi:MAG: hypothetical protein PHU46_12110 [Rhodocyclaceae bacterium]|nr:hypothetical protein [Rhodocyclaceae bacterium]
MDWKDLAGPLAKIAPLVGTLIGGPAGPLIGGLVSAALGTEATPDAIHQAIQTDPEAAVKVAQIESDNRVHMQTLAVQAEGNRLAAETAAIQADAADRDSARRRESTVQDKTNRNLAYLVVGSFLALVGGTLLGYSHVESALAGTLVGYLSAKCEQIIAYYFGSSRGSDKKTDLLAQAPAIPSAGNG